MFSSATEDGSVETLFASYDTGDRGDENDECAIDRGLVGPRDAVGSWIETSTGARSRIGTRRRGELSALSLWSQGGGGISTIASSGAVDRGTDPSSITKGEAIFKSLPDFWLSNFAR